MHKTITSFFIAVSVASLLLAFSLTASAEELLLPAPAILPLVEPKKEEPLKPQVQSIRIGLVDIVRAGRESKQGKAAQVEIKDKADKLQAKIEAKKKQFEKLKTSIEAKLPTYTQEQRMAKGKELEKKYEEVRKLAMDSDKQLQSLQEEITGKIYMSIEKAAAVLGKVSGYSVIIPKRDLLFQNVGVEGVDVTDDIIKMVDANIVKP